MLYFILQPFSGDNVSCCFLDYATSQRTNTEKKSIRRQIFLRIPPSCRTSKSGAAPQRTCLRRLQKRSCSEHRLCVATPPRPRRQRALRQPGHKRQGRVRRHAPGAEPAGLVRRVWMAQKLKTAAKRVLCGCSSLNRLENRTLSSFLANSFLIYKKSLLSEMVLSLFLPQIPICWVDYIRSFRVFQCKSLLRTDNSLLAGAAKIQTEL